MKNFKFKDESLKPVLRENLDRDTKRTNGDLPKHEDEELVNMKNPSKKFIHVEDVEDDKPLPDQFEDRLEEDEGEEDKSELETDEEDKISNQEFSNNDKKRLYQIREAIQENTGKIGSVSVSADEGRVDVFREPATKNDKHHLSPMTKEEKEILMENYAPYDADIPSRKMRSEAYKDFMAGSKIEQRESKKHGESHRGDNMKTLSDSKLQKQNRNVLRRFFGKWYAPKNENHRDN